MRSTLLPLLLFFSLYAVAQGRYTGPLLKKLLNQTYTDSKKIHGLEGYRFREGSLVSAFKDPKQITVDVFQKGTTAVVFFSIMKDTINKKFTILDVLEVKNVSKGWEVRTALCRQDKKDDVDIVALAKQSKADYLTDVKQAWRFNRGKLQFESIPVEGIDCFNEGGD